MLENVPAWLPASQALLPHGTCLLWSPGLMSLHVASDALIGLSYYSIPFGLAFFVRRRSDLAYRWIFLLFAAFILACGTTHFFEIWTLWRPDYATQGVLKAVTAGFSLSTAVLLWPVLHRALELPSPKQLAAVNAELTREIASRREMVRRLEVEADERRQLEEKLRRNEARLRAILDTAVEGILTIDEQGTVEMCNPAAARIFGYSAEEVLGRNVDRLMPDPHAEAHRDYLDRYRATGNGSILGRVREVTGLRKDGSTFPVEIAVGEFANGGRHFTGILRDITDRKRAEQAVRDSEERLQQQQAELLHVQRLSTAGELAGMMAHELNQPLGAIANYLGGITLRYGPVLEAHPSLAEAIEATQRLSARASQVVWGIRDLVRRRESGREWVAPGLIVEETLALLRPELERRQIRLQLAIPPALPQLWGRRVQLQQLLLNLMLNAMDAMAVTQAERRKLTVRARSGGAGAMEIEIADTGSGFKPELAEQLFEPFVTTKPEGIGLGLAICRSIAEAHGGRISARSVLGQGSTFTVNLPTDNKEPASHD
jgi:two-component system sensor kinase FixL